MLRVEQIANNQFIIHNNGQEIFQSYDSIIAIKEYGKPTSLSPHYDYSRTTMKYLNKFLGHDMRSTRLKIKNGEYLLNINTRGQIVDHQKEN